jgi:hypothetical protein
MASLIPVGRLGRTLIRERPCGEQATMTRLASTERPSTAVRVTGAWVTEGVAWVTEGVAWRVP